MHHRLSPRVHHFSYRIFMFALDLDEIDEVARRVPIFSRNRANLYSFRDRDHLTLPGFAAATTKQNVRALLSRHGIPTSEDVRITLITLPRVMGYVFNPVSFYFCTHPDGTPLCAVAEVSNTFGEMKPYVLRERSGDGPFRLVTPKHFYVSPFCDLDLEFDFSLRVPGDRLDIHIDDRKGKERVLVTSLLGRRVPLTGARLTWFTVKYPLITLRVIGLIHWHALLLWLKRVPWRRKVDDIELQRGVFKPHTSKLRATHHDRDCDNWAAHNYRTVTRAHGPLPTAGSECPRRDDVGLHASRVARWHNDHGRHSGGRYLCTYARAQCGVLPEVRSLRRCWYR